MGQTDSPRAEPWKWGVVWLLFLATVINYMDRMTYNSTSKYLIQEFGMSERDYALVETAFAFSFGPMQLVAGFLVDRYSLKWLYAASLLVWSAAGFATGLVDTFAMLIVCRVILGVGESFNWPCAVGVIQRIIPRESRSFANALFHGGTSIGAVITPIIVAVMITQGWRSVFMVVGGGGAFWVILWLSYVRGERAAAVDRTTASTAATGFWGLFRSRQIWIAAALGISINLCWHLYRIFLVRYLDRDLHFGFREQQLLFAFYFLAADLGSIALGFVPGWLVGRGWPILAARRLMMFVTSGLCLLSAPVVLVGDSWLVYPLLALVGTGALGGFANYFAMTQDVAPAHTAKVIGFTGTASWIMVGISSYFTGVVADALGSYFLVFLFVGVFPLLGTLVALLWRDPVAPLADA